LLNIEGNLKECTETIEMLKNQVKDTKEKLAKINRKYDNLSRKYSSHRKKVYEMTTLFDEASVYKSRTEINVKLDAVGMNEISKGVCVD
jgi:chromosome segregation ATPase